jgi:hypothetical protein
MGEEYELWFRSGGKLLKGWFYVLDREVFVRSEYGRQHAHLGGSTPTSIATTLLLELAREAGQQK